MIHTHQPTIFGSKVVAAVSSVKNGNMKLGLGEENHVRANREAFLREVGIQIQDTTLVNVTYNTDDFVKYQTVTPQDKGGGMVPGHTVATADALVVDEPNHALFLLLADCVGAILYDEAHRVLMVSHLGRHSVEMQGASRSVEYLRIQFDTHPDQLKVWLSPGVGNTTYPLRAFEAKSLHQVITSQLHAAGVVDEHIENSNINTAASEEYYSHSEYLKGKREVPGRFAVVAQMRTQGEPAA